MTNQILQTAKERDDDWRRQVIGRLEDACDLVAEEASYHRACMSAFRANRHSQLGKGGGRPQDEGQQRVFDLFCDWFKNEIEDNVFTLEELHTKMVDDFSEGEVYSRKHFEFMLSGKYKDDVYFANEESRICVVCLKDKVKEILRDHKKSNGKRRRYSYHKNGSSTDKEQDTDPQDTVWVS